MSERMDYAIELLERERLEIEHHLIAVERAARGAHVSLSGDSQVDADNDRHRQIVTALHLLTKEWP